MKGYKLLTRDPDTKMLYSFLAGWDIKRGTRTCYRGTTKPRKGSGPLCVFVSRELAVSFHRFRRATTSINGLTPAAELWEVNYTPSYATTIWDSEGHKRDYMLLPDGTALASKIRLVELVGHLP